MGSEIGINLYSVHKPLSEDFSGTLEKLAGIGYSHVELLSVDIVSQKKISEIYTAAELRQRLDATGLKASAVHEVNMNQHKPLDQDWEAIAGYYAEAGCPAVIVPWLWFNNREDTLRDAELLDGIGNRIKAGGSQLYFHNHGHEFRCLDNGETMFDLLAANTDAAHLKFQLDVIWVQLAGFDPAEVMAQYGERCDMIHQNDIHKLLRFDTASYLAELAAADEHKTDLMGVYMKAVQDPFCSNLGEGAFDFDGFYRKVHAGGHLRHLVVENETAQEDRLERVAKDYGFIKKYADHG